MSTEAPLQFTTQQLGGNSPAKPAAPAPEVVASEVPVAAAAPATPAEDPQMSPRFAALARKERSLRMERQRVAQERAQWSAREAELKKAHDAYTQAKSDPIKALEAMGLTYQQITEAVLNNNQPTADHKVSAVEQELQKLRQELADRDKKQLETQAQRAQQEAEAVLTDFKDQINEHIKTNTDKYELTALNESEELVYDAIEEHYARTKQVLSIEKAAELVEQFWEDRQKMILSKSKKLKPAAPVEDKSRMPSGSPTLHNGLQSTTPSMLPPATENDRMRRAMAALDK